MPTVTTLDDSSGETDEQIQVIIKEFPDEQSGLLAEVYPETNEEAYSNGPVRSASCVYLEDIGAKKEAGAEFIEEVDTWVGTEHPDDLYVFVARTDEDDGYRVEVGEDWGNGLNSVLLVAEFTDEELGLKRIPELQDI